MKADQTGFITKNAKKHTIIRHKVRQAVQRVLLASLLTSMASCQFSSHQSEQDSSAKKEIIHKPKTPETNKNTYLSDKTINKIMATPCPPALDDMNFNHLPENTKNFWEIVLNGVEKTNQIQSSQRLSDDQKAEYKITARKMLAQISHTKGNIEDVDLTDYNNLKSFIYFEKVLQYGDNYWIVLGKSYGDIDERAEIFGRYYQDQEALKEKANKHPGIEKFAKALYMCDERFVLNYEDSIRGNEISRQLLDDWLKRQNVKDVALWYYADIELDSDVNTVVIQSARGCEFKAMLGIDPKGDLGDGYYSPVGSTIIHELQHLMQKKPTSGEQPEDNQKADEDVVPKRVYYDDFIMELGPTLYSLAVEDAIYKKIHQIDQNKVVDYGYIQLETHKVSIGQVAVWFSKMLDKYPNLSIDKVLAEPEVFNHINHLGNNSLPKDLERRQGR